MVLCGVFVWARRRLNGLKRRFPARAVEITVLPVPLNLIEHGVDICMRGWVETHMRTHVAYTTLSWGRHYVWPLSTLPFEIQMAKQAYALKAKRKKAAKKLMQGSAQKPK